ncbi:MAG TPA: amino acid aminotransferase [Pirellulaceae bacterium]|nr:amino acid aminotransferase [Pirellulaceae bacterium]
MTSTRNAVRHFVDLSTAPADPVFGLAEAFRLDTNPQKINLTVGAYQNDDGLTPVMDCVKHAEARLLQSQTTKNYLPIDGRPRFRQEIQHLLLGADHEAVDAARAVTIQTPGGTGALRLAGEFVRLVLGRRAIWISDPTWANHPQIFQASGLEVRTYPYLRSDQTGLNVAGVLERLETATAGDVVLLHTICHNPTGFDFDREAWLTILELVERRGLVPLFDFAYQGFGSDLDGDAWPVRHFCRELPEVLICNSFSKNLGLYSERVGGLTCVLADPDNARAAHSQLKQLVRTIYSTPPEHGGAVAETILSEPELRRTWLTELTVMRERIRDIRLAFVEGLKTFVPHRDFAFMLQQRGMFSYSGLSKAQVIRLREKYGIYLVESGRINVAGINHGNLTRLCQAIADVVSDRGS